MPYISRIIDILDITTPILLAPMYLVTNEDMIIAACKSGATGAIPAMNWTTPREMAKGIELIKSHTDKNFGINLISHRSNRKLAEQMQVCIDKQVGFIITSLGNPEAVINKCKPHGIKVFCDVVDTRHAKHLETAGADALIAVNRNAGGHAGTLSAHDLISNLKQECSIPIISAGGVATNNQLEHVFNLGAEAVSVGTAFIASHESNVCAEYKKAVIEYSGSDIVFTERLSGTPCAVIKTPYVEKIGTKQNIIERFLNKNKRIKRYLKQYAYAQGMRTLQKAAFSATYQTVWVAGPSIEHITESQSVTDIITQLKGTTLFTSAR